MNDLSATATAAEASEEAMSLPEWNLSELYAAPDAPAIQADLHWAETQAKDFNAAYAGRIEDLDGGDFGQAIQRFEAIIERLHKIMSYAQLVFAGDMSDSERGRFLQTMQERYNAIYAELLFFTLEINRIEDAVLWAVRSQGGLPPLPNAPPREDEPPAMPRPSSPRHPSRTKTNHPAGHPRSPILQNTSFLGKPCSNSATTAPHSCAPDSPGPPTPPPHPAPPPSAPASPPPGLPSLPRSARKRAPPCEATAKTIPKSPTHSHLPRPSRLTRPRSSRSPAARDHAAAPAPPDHPHAAV